MLKPGRASEPLSQLKPEDQYSYRATGSMSSSNLRQSFSCPVFPDEWMSSDCLRGAPVGDTALRNLIFEACR